METKNPSKIIRYDLLVVLVALSCSLAAEHIADVFRSHGGLHGHFGIIFATIAFSLNVLNFLHGKTVLLEDEVYNRVLVNLPKRAIADFVLNVSITITFVFISLFLDSARFILIGNILIRILDVFLIKMVESSTVDKAIKKSQSVWLKINVYLITLYLLLLVANETFLIITGSANILDEWIIPIIYLVSIVCDVIVDYGLNSELYFSSPGTWDKLADLWDAVQGDDGDIYREWVIIPRVEELRDLFEKKNVLDLGCGNGCLARKFQELGAKSIVAIDKYRAMIERAEDRGTGGSFISYQELDFAVSNPKSLKTTFDTIFACFSLQDCENLDNAFQFISSHLSVGGSLLLIFENENAFSKASHFTSERFPIGTHGEWLLSWSAESLVLGLSSKTSHLRDEILIRFKPEKVYSSITRFWEEKSYIEKAFICGLSPQENPAALQVKAQINLPSIIRRYRELPKISSILFRKQKQ